VILIDSNIPVYLAGAPGTRKTDTQHWLERLVSERQRLVTDAEVLQEILYRYSAINRPYDIPPAFDALLTVVDEVLPIDRAVVERAQQIVLSYPRLSARDSVHLAVMEQHGIERILTFDTGFDGFPGIARLS
jgi:predicted nucleic acid-binding protein